MFKFILMSSVIVLLTYLKVSFFRCLFEYICKTANCAPITHIFHCRIKYKHLIKFTKCYFIKYIQVCIAFLLIINI